MINRLNPPLVTHGTYPTHPASGLILAVNHYHRPGFGAWWIALSIAATCPWEAHWTLTSAWIYNDPLRSTLITPGSQWLLARLARCYGFTTMPPMPPRPHELPHRAKAIRNLLRYVEQTPTPILGFAPEGADASDGCLSKPPVGVGRFIGRLFQRGLRLLPLGVYENDRGLVLSIGAPIKPNVDVDPATEDSLISEMTMKAIAACLPHSLRGIYA
jgi:hypothetical protein